MATYESIITQSKLNVHFDICCTNNHIVPNHWHSHLEILYILEGSMDVRCNEREYKVMKNEMFVFNSGDIHFTYSRGETQLVLLQIPYEYLQGMIDKFNEIEFEHYYSKDRFDNDNLKRIRDLLIKMKELYEKTEDGYALLFGSCLNQLIYELYIHFSRRNAGRVKEDRNMNRLKEIITYIEKRYREQMSQAQVAGEFGLNPEYFCRYFKKNIGFTFLEYVNMIRLQRIYEDLLHTGESVSTLCHKHGFVNDKVFHRMFKEVYGCTPTAARVRGRIT